MKNKTIDTIIGCFKGYAHGLIQPIAFPHYVKKDIDYFQSFFESMMKKENRMPVIAAGLARLAGVATIGYFVVNAIAGNYEHLSSGYVVSAMATTNTLSGILVYRDAKRKSTEKNKDVTEISIDELLKRTEINKEVKNGE